MPSGITLIGRVIANQPDGPGLTIVTVQYEYSVPVADIINGGMITIGDAVAILDITQTDQEIEAILRDAVAADATHFSGLSFTSADVRGCRL